MTKEITALREFDVFEVVDRQPEMHVLGTRWIYSTKHNSEERSFGYKARCVVQGNRQIPERDFVETFAPVARTSTMQILLTMTAIENYSCIHLDVSTAYLHSQIETQIYVKPPPGIHKEDKVWMLKKSLYGLKQAGRNWFLHLKLLLEQNGLKQSQCDQGLFISNEQVYVLVYVDDLLVMAKEKENGLAVYNKLAAKLKMKNLGDVSRFLGWNIKRKEKVFELDQKDFIEKLIEENGLSAARTMKSPMDSFVLTNLDQEVNNQLPVREIIGGLQYLAQKSRPDIAATIQFLNANKCINQP